MGLGSTSDKYKTGLSVVAVLSALFLCLPPPTMCDANPRRRRRRRGCPPTATYSKGPIRNMILECLATYLVLYLLQYTGNKNWFLLTSSSYAGLDRLPTAQKIIFLIRPLLYNVLRAQPPRRRTICSHSGTGLPHVFGCFCMFVANRDCSVSAINNANLCMYLRGLQSV